MTTVAITVDVVETNSSTVAYGHGTDPDGKPWWFVGEPRALHDIAEALQRGEQPTAVVEPWQLLGEAR